MIVSIVFGFLFRCLPPSWGQERDPIFSSITVRIYGGHVCLMRFRFSFPLPSSLVGKERDPIFSSITVRILEVLFV
jgi:hypothetical protein